MYECLCAAENNVIACTYYVDMLAPLCIEGKFLHENDMSVCVYIELAGVISPVSDKMYVVYFIVCFILYIYIYIYIYIYTQTNKHYRI